MTDRLNNELYSNGGKTAKEKDMKKTFWGTFIMGMAFASVLAGCATSGGSETSPTLETEQLAADLNTIKAGSATIDGGTVRLTGEVYLTTSLTVPAGVTLDLMAEGVKFELQDGAELTVDGTVNTSGHGDQGKGWVEGGLCIGRGIAVINGSGTIHLQSKGCLFNIYKDGRHLTIDGVTLAGIADNNEPLVIVGGGGALVMKSGAIMGNTNAGGGEFQEAGGVFMGEGGTFFMEGGTISRNTNNRAAQGGDGGGGGGVFVSDDATFTMKDGTISDNAVGGTGKIWSGGGGVNVCGTFIMEGGIISGNSASGKEAKGGGVNTVGPVGVFTMKGGIISGNNVGGEEARGGGVATEGEGGVFTMLGGTIYGSAAAANAGGNANETRNSRGTSVTGRGAAISYGFDGRAKWGTGGTYTKGGVPQTGGSEIAPLRNDGFGGTDDTLIAIPGK